MDAFEIKKLMEAVNLSLELYNSEGFSDWYDGLPTTKNIVLEKIQAHFVGILRPLNEKRRLQSLGNISQDDFITLLQNETLVGKRIANCFRDFSLSLRLSSDPKTVSQSDPAGRYVPIIFSNPATSSLDPSGSRSRKGVRAGSDEDVTQGRRSPSPRNQSDDDE